MKELSIEEKAKAYDEALSVAQETYTTQPMYRDWLAKMFPELKESEDEKWIPKEIAKYLKEKGGFRSCWLAWLEKQDEYKSPEEVLKIRQELYQSGYNDGYKHGCEDSKKQDKQILANSTKNCKVEHKFKVGDEIKTDKEEPLLITKIDEEGYWSEDLFICSFDEEHLWDLVLQNPTDKIEPKFKVGDTIKCKYDDRQFTIKSVDLDKGTYTYTQEGCGNDIDYADENFELVGLKPAWSEEDENILRTIISDGIRGAEIDMLQINWLKAIKKRVACEANCTTTKQWSEDEESIINKAESWLDTLCDYLKDSSPEYISDIKDVINKLKSIKDRIGG